MASAYSQVREYNKFIPPVDLELMAKTMSVKQEAYNANYASIQGQIDKLDELDLIKGEDKEYLAERSKNLINDFKKLGSINLSSSAVTKQLSNHLSQVFDKKVVTALASTAKYRGFQAEIETVKSKNPDKYSVINEMYALRPFQNWFNDGTAGSSLGDMNYVPKVDVNEKYTKLLKEAYTSKGTYKFQVPDPSNKYGLVEREFSGLHEEEISGIIGNMMTAEERQQLAINGWYNMGSVSNEQADVLLEKVSKRQNEEYKGAILRLKDEINKAPSKTRQEELQKELSAVTEASKQYKSQIGSIKGSAENIGYFFEQQKLMGGLKEMYKYEMKSETFKKDEAYAAQQDAIFKQQAFNLDVAKFDYERQKDAAAAELLAQENQDLAIRVPGSTDNLEEIDTYTNGVKKVYDEDKAVTEQVYEAIREQYKKDNPDARIADLEQEAAKAGVPVATYMASKLDDKGLAGELSEKYHINQNKKKVISDTYSKVLYTHLKTFSGLPDDNSKLEALAESYARAMASTTVFSKEDRNYYSTLFSVMKDAYGKKLGPKSVLNTFNPQGNKVEMLRTLPQDSKSAIPAALRDRVYKAIDYGDRTTQATFLDLAKQLGGKVLFDDAYSISTKHPKFEAIFTAASSAVTGKKFDKNFPITLEVKEGKVRLSQIGDEGQIITQADVDKSYFGFLENEFDLSGEQMRRKTGFTQVKVPVQSYGVKGANTKWDDSYESFMPPDTIPLMYSEDVKRSINTLTNDTARQILTKVIDNADQFTLVTEQAPYTKKVKIKAKTKKDAVLGEIEVSLDDWNKMDKKILFAAPQVFLSQIVSKYINSIQNDPNNIPTLLSNLTY